DTEASACLRNCFAQNRSKRQWIGARSADEKRLLSFRLRHALSIHFMKRNIGHRHNGISEIAIGSISNQPHNLVMVLSLLKSLSDRILAIKKGLDESLVDDRLTGSGVARAKIP